VGILGAAGWGQIYMAFVWGVGKGGFGMREVIRL